MMNLTLDYLRSNRKWLVPNILVWGNADACRPKLLLTEDSDFKRVMYSSSVIGGSNQSVNYEDLTDNRGNQLPPEIKSPVVIIIPRNSIHCFLMGKPSTTGFKIARGESITGLAEDGLIDLLIMEVDLP